jgi:hypothetical protein
VNFSCSPQWATEHAWVPLPVAGGYIYISNSGAVFECVWHERIRSDAIQLSPLRVNPFVSVPGSTTCLCASAKTFSPRQLAPRHGRLCTVVMTVHSRGGSGCMQEARRSRPDRSLTAHWPSPSSLFRSLSRRCPLPTNTTTSRRPVQPARGGAPRSTAGLLQLRR